MPRPCVRRKSSFNKAGQAWEVDRTIETMPLQGNGAVEINLHDGWNVVSNPLEVSVPWNAVQAATGTEQPLWRWKGSWERTSTFKSATEGAAYYFRDEQVDRLTVPFPMGGSQSALTKAGSTRVKGRPKKRTLRLSVLEADTLISTVEAGVQPGAKTGLDRYDQYGPPGYFTGATLRLMHKEEEKSTVALAAEWKPPEQEGYSYNVRLRAKPEKTVHLATEGLAAFEEQAVSLVIPNAEDHYTD